MGVREARFGVDSAPIRVDGLGDTTGAQVGVAQIVETGRVAGLQHACAPDCLHGFCRSASLRQKRTVKMPSARKSGLRLDQMLVVASRLSCSARTMVRKGACQCFARFGRGCWGVDGHLDFEN